MFLSMYVAFRLSDKPEQEYISYVLLMAGFIIVASFLSAFVGGLWLWLILLYPFLSVSFPFFSTPEVSCKLLRFQYLYSYECKLTGYHINFVGIEIMFISPQNVLVYGFLFFLLINLVGAILGYWIKQKTSDESLKLELFDFFFRSGILSFLVCYGILLLDWFALGLIIEHGANDGWFALASNIWFFCQYLFWVPAVIATAIYGIYKWMGMRKERIS